MSNEYVNPRADLYRLLYDELDPMPPELIHIIMEYDAIETNGVSLSRWGSMAMLSYGHSRYIGRWIQYINGHLFSVRMLIHPADVDADQHLECLCDLEYAILTERWSFPFCKDGKHLAAGYYYYSPIHIGICSSMDVYEPRDPDQFANPNNEEVHVNCATSFERTPSGVHPVYAPSFWLS
jgi:hypothetical protein